MSKPYNYDSLGFSTFVLGKLDKASRQVVRVRKTC